MSVNSPRAIVSVTSSGAKPALRNDSATRPGGRPRKPNRPSESAYVTRPSSS